MCVFVCHTSVAKTSKYFLASIFFKYSLSQTSPAWVRTDIQLETEKEEKRSPDPFSGSGIMSL